MGHSTAATPSDLCNVRSLPRQMINHIQYSADQLMNTIDHQTSSSTVSIKPVREYHSRSDVDATNHQIVQGYTQMVTDRIEKDWTCNLVTFLFSQLPGTKSAVICQMKDEIQRVYSTLLTRVHRKPRTASPDELPVLIAAADLRVYKRDRSSSPIVLCNGGLHFHALLLVPVNSRLEVSVDEHVRSNQGLYCGGQGTISAIHLRLVTDAHERVVDYVFKTILRGRVSYDEGILLLPRASQELAAGMDRLLGTPRVLPQ
jgi:hypothetical protein